MPRAHAKLFRTKTLDTPATQPRDHGNSVALNGIAPPNHRVPGARSNEFAAEYAGTCLEAAKDAMLIPEPGLVVLIASGLLALASVLRTTTLL